MIRSAWQFAQRSGNYTNLYNILYNDVMVNNGNLNKAVIAGLAFWGVRNAANLASCQSLTNTSQ